MPNNLPLWPEAPKNPNGILKFRYDGKPAGLDVLPPAELHQGTGPAQLLSRHWIIVDANQERQEVRGDGVIGEQPLIEAGESYQYTSGVMLDTPIGTMQGSYQLVDDQGEHFEAQIKPFLLSTPHAVH